MSNKRAAKRPAFSGFSSDPSSSTVSNERVMEPPSFGIHRAESSNQKSIAAPTSLDPKRASSSQQHVRALNKQFASWVKSQLENHQDELWEDGINDYLSHAKQIKENFKDVVDWLKSNSEKPKPVPKFGSFCGTKPLEITNGPAKQSSPVERNKPALRLEVNNGFSRPPINTVFSNSDNPPTLYGSSGSEKESKPTQQTDSYNGSFKPSAPLTFSFGSNSNANSSSNLGANFGSNLGANSGTQNTTPFSTGFTFSSSGQQSSSLFSFAQPPAFSGTPSFNSNAPSADASENNEEEENEEDEPSSPSVKKREEKGVLIVHESKCKVCIMPENSAEKGWKDMGIGHLVIKTKEGEIKATQDSKPTIVIRNDVGKILLNALIYSGIKTNVQKNTMTSVFHTSDEAGSVVSRTYLLKLKNADEAVKLADTIKDNAPSD